jgi:bisphosphoglycerate-independent phosphoglycerate mutase (AlkP superfamily)
MLLSPETHTFLDAAFESVLGRTMTSLERDAKRYEREVIERRERWYQMSRDQETDRSRMLRGHPAMTDADNHTPTSTQTTTVRRACMAKQRLDPSCRYPECSCHGMLAAIHEGPNSPTWDDWSDRVI